MEKLLDSLKREIAKEKVSAHMPGHKYKAPVTFDAYAIDTTELEATDNLFCANGVLKKSQEEVASIYNASATRFLVGGSSVGLIASIMAIVGKGDSVVVPYDAHKSIYNALLLTEADVMRVIPQYDSSRPTSYSEKDYLDYIDENTKLVVITTPNYFGFVTNIERIVQKAKRYGAYILIDEAHGAHLNFFAPELSALYQGADIVVQSAHKTLPALTQTAMLHYGEVSNKLMSRVDNYLEILQTSSPSYVLMVSLDLAVKTYHERRDEIKKRSLSIYKYIKNNFAEFIAGELPPDFYKLWLSALPFGYDGQNFSNYLKSKGIMVELHNQHGALLYLSPQTSLGDLEYLTSVLAELPILSPLELKPVERPMLPKRLAAGHYGQIAIAIEDAATYYSAENVIPYPTGAPLLLKGDYIDKNIQIKLQELCASGHSILGMADKEFKTIKVYEKSN